ncbi:hypothetical protein K435DRAFT_887394 [Dendrothele bispora CBS 962.96]|uniref:Uncharacterized protein n=1 Tax=Dendrothele bispora (strain CBS 962.96) TaxID=1314807 RepID=A0A4S8KS01_DENBC|nr:hypothetical protein K435DRAFT_887394 [Dendrothele bispora CBS 962.96]
MLLLYALARPLPSLLASTNNGSLPSPEVSLEAHSSCFDIRSCRTVEDILYSCLAVVFACTWVAIHPNIPRHFDVSKEDSPEVEDSFTISRARVFTQYVITMILSIVAPELIVLWALRQWFAARKIAKKYSEPYGWTKTHGHFLIMGGFALFEDGRYVYTLEDSEMFKWFWRSGFLIQHKYIDITEDEITAKSKTDFLTKFIALLQTTWFILQCIARVAEGLVVTDLEIVTVAFALLNIATYILWWNKPQHVRYPVKVDYCRRHATGTSRVKVKAQDRSVKKRVKTMLNSLCDWLCQRSTSAWKSFTDWIEEPWKDLIRHSWPVRIIIFLILDVTIFNVGSLFCVEGSYQTGLESDPPSLYPTGISLFLVFGGIHCSPWNSTFPTHTEKILWRISAVTVATFPLAWFASFGVDQYCKTRSGMNLIQRINILIGVLLLPLAYIFTRITLIVIAFTELRALPPSAYQTVDWARFIPHI